MRNGRMTKNGANTREEALAGPGRGLQSVSMPERRTVLESPGLSHFAGRSGLNGLSEDSRDAPPCSSSSSSKFSARPRTRTRTIHSRASIAQAWQCALPLLLRWPLLACTVFALGRLTAQTSTNELTTGTITNTPPVVEPAVEKAWSFSVSAFGYLVPDDQDFVQPTVTADRGWLHLEARYNYEALETASVWVGYNFSVGEKVSLDFTPMLGGVFGDIKGVAPGYKASLSWWKLELYSEGEYVVDARDSSGNFFYTWSELSLSPVDWFRFGVVTQRTRAYESDLDIQRGFLAGVTCKKLSFTTYVFNPDQDRPTVVLAAGVSF